MQVLHLKFQKLQQSVNDKILMSFKILNIFFTIMMNPRKELY